MTIASPATTTVSPGGLQTPAPNSAPQLDRMVAQLNEGASRFVRWPLRDRLQLARDLQAGLLERAEDLVRAGCRAKGIAFDSSAAGDEWATGPWPVIRQLRLLAESLDRLAREGTTPLGPIHRTAGGCLAARVFPTNRIDGVLFAGITVETRFQPEVSEETLRGRGSFYHGPGHDGRTVLILGAGNLAAIPAMDVLSKMFNEGKACLLKMSPVNAYVGPILERALAAAIRQDVLRIAYGGPPEGGYLIDHPGIQEIHLTGSDQTYDRILWGAAGPERESRKAQNRPLVSKPVTAELGNVSPVLVAPGPYRPDQLAFQAASIAGAATVNAAFCCNSPRVLVTPRGWSRRAALLDRLAAQLRRVPPRPAYYPGAVEQWHQLVAGRAELRQVGQPGGDTLPWTLLPGLDATDLRERAFLHEAFCPVLAETEVGSDDPVEFLDRAVDFANNRLWGTLSADLVVHPDLLKDPRTAGAVERAIERLRYGVISLNSWTGFAFTYASAPWGGYPGSTPRDIQSGAGWVHNTSMLEGMEKVVLRHPLTLRPKPATFPGHRTAGTLMRRMTRLDAEPRWRHVPGVIAAAVGG